MWLDVQRSVDLAHFVAAAVRIITCTGRRCLSPRQQNEIVGTLLHVSGETVRLWRRGPARPGFDKLLALIVEAADACGGEYALLVEIYGEDKAAQMWGQA
ncbi:MAG: hypothetical protein Q4G24_10755 [Paracoccus sp. (in: a-proteobacteria)]|uniref:hypothetical protein n=1 Tax=Paracoccus sp. TaxID=267 RepID=UPI0026E0005C|nr:hypothetical protein [Paracoccus sp. (in: a-proteobacteria)]MDO5621938.1 hypothetical protein [Paracoccus sp. (in: a-proteobacteria)]